MDGSWGCYLSTLREEGLVRKRVHVLWAGYMLWDGDVNVDNVIVTGDGSAQFVNFENCRLRTEEER